MKNDTDVHKKRIFLYLLHIKEILNCCLLRRNGKSIYQKIPTCLVSTHLIFNWM